MGSMSAGTLEMRRYKLCMYGVDLQLEFLHHLYSSLQVMKDKTG